MDFTLTAAVYILIITGNMVGSIHPDCSTVLHLQQKEKECELKMKTASAASLHSSNNKTAGIHSSGQDVSLYHFEEKIITGCVMDWDGVSCWPTASEEEIISIRCPLLLLKHETPPAFITRKCTVRGWSEPSLPYYKACYDEAHEQDEDVGKEKNYFDTLKLIYSVGYGASLTALIVAVLVFCCFRKLLCTRSYIHLNLFVSSMLRSLAVFIKDAVLFADKSTDHCTVSTLQCKAAVTFFHFCVLSNFSWLLVEGLYLQTLLLFTFIQTRKLLWSYAITGWGCPSVTVVIWVLLKTQLDDEGCWDNLESCLWWIIKIPVLFSTFINFVIFLNISRIIFQKTKATHVNQSETRVYRRLVRSTLLLIPLFGVHYVVFALIPEHVAVGPRLYLELILGSFQVQKEIQRAMKRCFPGTKTRAVNQPTEEDVP